VEGLQRPEEVADPIRHCRTERTTREESRRAASTPSPPDSPELKSSS